MNRIFVKMALKLTLKFVYYFNSTGRTAVKISLRSFEDAYYYTVDRLPALKSYLEGSTNQQGDLAVKVSCPQVAQMQPNIHARLYNYHVSLPIAELTFRRRRADVSSTKAAAVVETSLTKS